MAADPGMTLGDLREAVEVAWKLRDASTPVLVHAGDEVYALDTADLDGTCDGIDVLRLTALDHDDDGHPVVPLVLVKQELPPEPTVVCASCGRSRDMPPKATPGYPACEAPEWHQPQPQVPDADVTAEDGDDLAPLTEDDLLAAVGPEPGKTWAELYARAALSLSYSGAELRGARQRVRDLEAGLAMVLRAAGGTVTVASADVAEVMANPPRQVYRASDPATGAVTWALLP